MMMLIIICFRCPEKKIATIFVHGDKGYAEAEIPMYRFADYNVVNIQCDILICKGIQICALMYHYESYLFINVSLEFALRRKYKIELNIVLRPSFKYYFPVLFVDIMLSARHKS